MVAAKAGTVKAEETRNDRHETMPVVPIVGFGQPGVMPGRSRRPRYAEQPHGYPDASGSAGTE